MLFVYTLFIYTLRKRKKINNLSVSNILRPERFLKPGSNMKINNINIHISYLCYLF